MKYKYRRMIFQAREAEVVYRQPTFMLLVISGLANIVRWYADLPELAIPSFMFAFTGLFMYVWNILGCAIFKAKIRKGAPKRLVRSKSNY